LLVPAGTRPGAQQSSHREGLTAMSQVVISKKVEQIWKDVLDAAKGQDGATFFELRGESISAVRLVSRVEDELGIVVDIADLFEEDPDLDTFVRHVVAKAAAA
jgi:acyl carrier protein